MPRKPHQEAAHSRSQRRGNALARRALPPLTVSRVSTTDLGKGAYRLLIRALSAEVKRLKAQGALDLEALGEAGKVLDLLTSGHATLEVKPTTTPSMAYRAVVESYPADLGRLIQAARGGAREMLPLQAASLEPKTQGQDPVSLADPDPGSRLRVRGSGDLGPGGSGDLGPGGHSTQDLSGTGTPSHIDVTPQPQALGPQPPTSESPSQEPE